MPEIKFDPSRVIPTAPINPPRRWETTRGPLGVGGAYCGCRRAGCYGFIEFEDDDLLKLPDLQTMCLEKESDNA